MFADHAQLPRRVDQENHVAELTTKVNETLVPQLQELPGFAGYYLVEAGNGIFTSFGMFKEQLQQAEASTRSSSPGRSARREAQGPAAPTSPRSRVARSSPRAPSTSWSRNATAPHSTRKGPACRALPGLVIECSRNGDVSETGPRWWTVRPAQNRKPATYRCPLCGMRFPVISEHMLIAPEGDPAGRQTRPHGVRRRGPESGPASEPR